MGKLPTLQSVAVLLNSRLKLEINYQEDNTLSTNTAFLPKQCFQEIYRSQPTHPIEY